MWCVPLWVASSNISGHSLTPLRPLLFKIRLQQVIVSGVSIRLRRCGVASLSHMRMTCGFSVTLLALIAVCRELLPKLKKHDSISCDFVIKIFCKTTRLNIA